MKHSISRFHVPRETYDATINLFKRYKTPLEEYIEQLFWWNKRVNLVSRDVSRETITHHVRHSLLLHSVEVFQKSDFIIDAGTGGGLPGLPLAITHPEKDFILNDIVSKKVLAVKQMTHKLQLDNTSTFDGSVAEVKTDHPFLLITKHAFKINALIQLTKGSPWTDIILYKGMDFEDELTGIEIPLTIQAHELSKLNSFYTNKAIVVISR